MTPPDCWVPVPIRARHANVGDVIVGNETTTLWTVTGRGDVDGQFRLDVAAGFTATSVPIDPDRPVQVLVPATERDALHLTRAELGARVESRRLNPERGAA